MTVFEKINEYNHEKIIFCYDKKSGLKAIIGIHDTTLGPALGGTRMYAYKSEEDAINDVLRLSKGMTYKAAALDIKLGGGKGVIIADSKQKRESLMEAYGKAIDGLNGLYFTAEDVGTNVDDMEIIDRHTKYVVGLKEKSGDPSPATAYGTFKGIQGAAEKIWGSSSLKGKKVAVQGLGNVGYYLCKYLWKNGASLIVTDVDDKKINRVAKNFFADYVRPREIFEVSADIFCPCAMGSVINPETISKLKVDIIAGAANNQLENEAVDIKLLNEKNILYVPDFIINAGGLINVAEEFQGYDKAKAFEKIEKIHQKVKKIIDISEEENVSTISAAYQIAKKRLKGYPSPDPSFSYS